MSNTDSRISILMYHQVARFKPMKTHRATYCQLRRFVAQMRWLALSRTSVISLDQCSRILHGQEAMPPHAVVLTFDDGYENFADNALPVLARYGFPATVYEPTGFIGGAADWLARDQLRPEAILSAEQLRALAGNPLVRIGAHGVHHRRLAEIPLHEAKSEIEESKAGLESLLQRPVRHFSTPTVRWIGRSCVSPPMLALKLRQPVSVVSPN